MTSTPSGTLPSEASVFLFATLLAELRSRGIGVGMHEYQELLLLASRWKGTDAAAFRDAVAALFARNRDEVETIRELFDEWLRREEQTRMPLPPPEPKPVRRKWWHGMVIVLIAAVAFGALTWWAIDRNRPEPQTISDGESDELPPEIPKPRPELPPEPREAATERLWIVAAVLLVAAVVASAVPQTRKRQRRWAQKYWRSVLASRPGPYLYEKRVTPSAPPVPRQAIEDVAVILGRAVDVEAVSEELDVDESLRLTLHEGLRPQLVFVPPPRNLPVLLLIDTAWQMRPWRRKIDWFVDELAREGVLLDRWYFDGDPSHVSRSLHGRPIPLEQLAATRTESRLMILGTGQAFPPDSFERVHRLLKKWAFRTWVHPIANPEYWRRELAQLPLRMWPMTLAGLHAAAAEISRIPHSDYSPLAAAAPRGVTRVDVQRMKELIAYVPHPSLELAEELRRRFAPDVPEEVILFLGVEGVFYGDAIRLPPEQLQSLMASADTQREREVRRYLLGVLRESEPAAGSVAHLRWQLDETLHRLRLGDASALETLRSLAEGPLKDEVLAKLEVVKDPRAALVKEEAKRVMPHTLRERPPESLGTRPPLWAWPRWHHALLAATVALVAALLLGRWVARGAGAVIPHERNAYALQWVEPELRVGGNGPRPAYLYRDGELVNDIQHIPSVLPGLPRGAWYEVRRQLPRGNWALSAQVWVADAKGKRESGELTWWIDDAISFRLMEIWVRLFGVQIDARFRPLDSIGGDEGLALRNAFREEFGLDFPENPGTLADLAAHVRTRLPNGSAVVILTGQRGRYRLTRGEAPGLSGTFDEPLKVAAGTYVLDVTRETIVLRPNELLRKTIAVPETASGILTITSLPDGVRLQDLRIVHVGRTSSLARRSTRLEPGSYTLSLEDDFHSWRRAVAIEPGKETRVDVDSEQEYGTVLLRGFDDDTAALVQKSIPDSRWTSSGGPVIRARYGTYAFVGLGRIVIVAGRQTVIDRNDSRVDASKLQTGLYLMNLIAAAIDENNLQGCAGWEVVCSTRACLMKGAIAAAHVNKCDEAVELTIQAICVDDALRKRLTEDTRDLCTFLKTR